MRLNAKKSKTILALAVILIKVIKQILDIIIINYFA